MQAVYKSAEEKQEGGNVSQLFKLYFYFGQFYKISEEGLRRAWHVFPTLAASSCVKILLPCVLRRISPEHWRFHAKLQHGETIFAVAIVVLTKGR